MISAGVALVTMVAAVVSGAESAGPPEPVEAVEITYAEGRVTADFQRAPLDEVIAVLGQRAGVEFHGELLDQREVSAHFDGARFRDVVDHLVGDQNFTILYDASRRPYRVELWGMPHRAPSVRAPAPTRGELARVVTQHAPIALPPLLATAFRAPTARLPWLLRRGLRDPNVAIRSATAALLVRTVNTDVGLRSAMQRTDDQTIGTLIRSWAGTAADEVLETLTSGASDPLIRSKARRILDRLERTQSRTRPPAM